MIRTLYYMFGEMELQHEIVIIEGFTNVNLWFEFCHKLLNFNDHICLFQLKTCTHF